MVPFGTASDGGGSIRTPASFTGLVGLKNTYGRIPTFGDTHLAQNAVVGCLTTTVADTALLLDVMAGPDARDRTCLPAPTGSYVDALDAVDLSQVSRRLVAGPRLRDRRPRGRRTCASRPPGPSSRQPARRLVDAADPARRLHPHLRVRSKASTSSSASTATCGRTASTSSTRSRPPGWTHLSAKTLPWAAAVEFDRRQLVADVAAIFDDVDLIVTPMSSMPPFAAEGPMPTEINGTEVHGGMAVVLAMLANLVNLPAVSVPAGLTAGGLPVGLQIIGPRFREDLLLAAAARYESARPWPRHCPARRHEREAN